MSLTKADIDALVTNMASRNFNPTAAWDALRKALYLAAGLTATGERKPERVRCWMYRREGQDDPRGITIGVPSGDLNCNGWEVILGTFVPDGAE